MDIELERSFRIFLDALGLKEKANSKPVDVAITGDGAAITTSTNNAGQCCVGLKFLDEDVLDPVSGEPTHYSFTEDGLKEYRNCHTQVIWSMCTQTTALVIVACLRPTQDRWSFSETEGHSSGWITQSSPQLSGVRYNWMIADPICGVFAA
jgi:hypothetical protein